MFNFSELVGLVRLAGGLRSFLRRPIDPRRARSMVLESMAQRQGRFLRKIDSAVFGRPASPYAALLRHAGCEPGDLRALVQREGVEGTLERLLRAGVYVTWEELKGRRPATRGSRTFHFRETDFDNPLIATHYRTSSSGSSGAPVRTRIDLTDFAEAAADWAVWFDAHYWMDRPLVFWTPRHVGMANRYLRCAKFGKPYERWFASSTRAPWPDRLRSELVHGLARLAGGFSRPEPVGVDEIGRVSDYLLAELSRGRRPLVNTTPSLAAKLSLRAVARGESLAGVTFLFGAEPVTPARRRAVEAAGATGAATYGSSEGGWIGAQFPDDPSVDGVHLFLDAFAAVAKPSAEPEIEPNAPRPILLTGLRPAGPKVLLNAEIGDSAVLERDAGDGAAAALGYDVRLHTIRSFRKVTAWGVTLARADLEPILEEALPRRFGGTFADYQLVEQETSDGLSRLRLRVSPEVGEIDDDAVRREFLRQAERLKSYYGFMGEILSKAKALEVERRRPIVSPNGKASTVVTGRGVREVPAEATSRR